MGLNTLGRGKVGEEEEEEEDDGEDDEEGSGEAPGGEAAIRQSVSQ
jgi:hypothetical protein